MMIKLYRDSLRRADWGLAVIVLLFLGTAVQRALQGSLQGAAVFGVLAGLLTLLRLVRGPMRGPALIEITASEIVFRQPFYIPLRTQRVRLDRVRTLEIAGGAGDRRFRFGSQDDERVEVRPRYGPFFEPRAIEFLRSHLADPVSVVVHPPASWLARAHESF